MGWGWYAGYFLLAAADWLAVGQYRQNLRIITKPTTMLVLIAGFSLAGGWAGQGYWFGMGLVLSLLGDIFLLMPPGFFIFGLAWFLLAHLFYIIGFNQGLPIISWTQILLVLFFVVFDAWGYLRLRRAILSRPSGRRIRYPLLFYILVITIMVLSALSTLFRADWPLQSAVLVSLGALLFFASDFTLANDRFVGPIKNGRLIVIVTYHLAQALICSAVLLR